MPVTQDMVISPVLQIVEAEVCFQGMAAEGSRRQPRPGRCMLARNETDPLSEDYEAATSRRLSHNDAFCDAAWTTPRITLLPLEERGLLAAITKMAANAAPLHGSDIAAILLDTERVLTPRQARAVHAILKRNPVVRERDPINFCCTATLIASFLSSPEQWNAIEYEKRQRFWDDGNTACSWANSGMPMKAGRPTYAEALAARATSNAALRCAAGPILTKALPRSVLNRAGPMARKRPALPVNICERIFAMAQVSLPRPLEVNWLQINGASWTESKRAVAMLLRRERDQAAGGVEDPKSVSNLKLQEIVFEAPLVPAAVVEAQRAVSFLSETYDRLAARLAEMQLAPQDEREALFIELSGVSAQLEQANVDLAIARSEHEESSMAIAISRSNDAGVGTTLAASTAPAAAHTIEAPADDPDGAGPSSSSEHAGSSELKFAHPWSGERDECVICMELKPVHSSLICPAHSASSSHLMCEDCVSGQVISLYGTAELRNREGGLCCYATDDKHVKFPRPTVFTRTQVEPLLKGEALRMYQEVALETLLLRQALDMWASPNNVYHL